MRVNVISATIQEFNGLRYYLCGFYFQRKGKRLHRVVWETLNGPVPSGFHVHHKDEDRSNNQPENLELLRNGAHLSLHGKAKAGTDKARKHMERIRPKASEWHRSEEGRLWHSGVSKKMWAEMEYVTKTCQVCGKEYQTSSQAANRSKFCHQNCKATALRRRRGIKPRGDSEN